LITGAESLTRLAQGHRRLASRGLIAGDRDVHPTDVEAELDVLMDENDEDMEMMEVQFDQPCYTG
jgi:hypothetical protein